MKRCEKCIMRIYDKETICQECENYKPLSIDWRQKEREFRKICDLKKGKGKYDCIVLLTGGKDSSYVLYYMAKIIKARVLAYTWDNEFIRPIAWENIKNAVECLKCDYRVHRYDKEKLKKLYRATLKTIGSPCNICPLLTYSTALPVALKEEIPLIVSGISIAQIGVDSSCGVLSRQEQREAFYKLYKVCAKLFLMTLKKHEKKFAQEVYNHIMSPLQAGIEHAKKTDFFPQVIPLSNFIDWLSIDFITPLIEDLKWRRPQKADSSHTNCMLEPLKGYFEYKKNITNTSSEISNLIRMGAISREQGLQDVYNMCLDGRRPTNVINDFIAYLGITDEEFEYYSNKKLSLCEKLRLLKLVKYGREIMRWITGQEKLPKRGKFVRL